MTSEKTELAIARADRVMRSLNERDGAVRDAARRERQRLNAGLGRTLARVGIAVGTISLATIVIGLIIPIGMFGFLAAVGLAIGVAALLLVSGGKDIAAPNVTSDLHNGEMVQRFDSYLFRTRRALPAPAQAEIDLLSAQLPPLRQTLERIADLDPNAQDARRLMSVHLPNLIDRYLHVPSAYREQRDGEGVSVDERLVEALVAGRQALTEISEKLARADMAAFETQGRFIQSRYQEKTLD
ncbi:hypothetical protein LVY65_01620 [Sphingomonas sp. G124]|uniref:Uncharacterized protein n=1 Tax=Sphingomonas cremea TaxID=2904799 RepID=A0A9X1QKM8_9SPHN|nr:hypothetical protein [Sphingomonas cremea]MCF2513767.1 hypothetical protein [Sphingomonas cremea]